jgi:proteic killer suppression protein
LQLVIKTFRHAGLRELFERGRSARVRADLHRRALVRLKALDEAAKPTDLDVPGFNFHRLQGRPVRYSVHVNGPWCVTFEWEDGDAIRVNLEQYH